MLRIPNLPHPSVPVGEDAENVSSARRAAAGVRLRAEAALGLGRAGHHRLRARGQARGSRFYVLKGAGARLQRALITWMLDLHMGSTATPRSTRRIWSRRDPGRHGQSAQVRRQPVPRRRGGLLVHPDRRGAGDQPLPRRDPRRRPLPIKHVAYTACFRREKMSAGRDVRGIKRGHQFDKVEMVKFVGPETSIDELMTLVDNAEDVCRGLGIPYRVIQMCTGDLSFTAAVKYDVELWAPGCGEWLEVSSCTNFGDFQARRANIRYRPEPGASPSSCTRSTARVWRCRAC